MKLNLTVVFLFLNVCDFAFALTPENGVEPSFCEDR